MVKNTSLQRQRLW